MECEANNASLRAIKAFNLNNPDLNEHDVIFGAGNGVKNIRNKLRSKNPSHERVEGYYKATNKYKKGIVIQQVMNDVHGNGGRFLIVPKKEEGATTDPVIDFCQDEKEIHEKIGQALRDKVKKLVKEKKLPLSSTSSSDGEEEDIALAELRRNQETLQRELDCLIAEQGEVKTVMKAIMEENTTLKRENDLLKEEVFNLTQMLPGGK